ncbi:MAG: DNA-protecting protein DprA [Clostridia bacterium]|nr:DNA-protecting protein DprA [Clostridia bacterium]
MSILENKENLKASVVEIADCSPVYPREWKGLTSPPKKVYALGDLSLLGMRKLTVVGSRKTPVPALKLGAEIVKELTSSFAIVTGAADGGDSAAIEGALEKGRVICVLAGGFSSLPQGNLTLLEKVAKRGLILSEYDFETSVRAYSYERRNELLAALGEGVFVLGAGEKSGALITAKYAQKSGKPIFALPYFPNLSVGVGCNRLIKEGGKLVENVQDIAFGLGVTLAKREKQAELSADEEKLYEILKEGEAHATELSQKTGIPVFKLRATLSSLEMKGLAVSLGGNRYTAI